MISAAATSGSEVGSVEWQFQLRNVTQGQDLFSGVVGASGGGYDFDNANSDHDDITDITGAINSANYSGNGLTQGASTFSITIDELKNCALV